VNRLLKLLLPAVDVELRPLPEANGGVGGVKSSSEGPLDPKVDERVLPLLESMGGAKAGVDFAERAEWTELALSRVDGAANVTEADAEVVAKVEA
jgi:hypothetical protein